jgi:hypothetical protein
MTIILTIVTLGVNHEVFCLSHPLPLYLLNQWGNDAKQVPAIAYPVNLAIFLIVPGRPWRIVVDRNNFQGGRPTNCVNPNFSATDHDAFPVTEQLRDTLLRDEALYLGVESNVVILQQLVFISQRQRLAFDRNADREESSQPRERDHRRRQNVASPPRTARRRLFHRREYTGRLVR